MNLFIGMSKSSSYSTTSVLSLREFASEGVKTGWVNVIDLRVLFMELARPTDDFSCTSLTYSSLFYFYLIAIALLSLSFSSC